MVVKYFLVGDKVDKASGYSFPGVVVSVFKMLDGQERYVVEFYGTGTEEGTGVLHIFSGNQLKPLDK